MALWSTFNWSDGTYWADANGLSALYSGMIDRLGYYVSLRFNHTNAAPPGSLTSMVVQSASLEARVGAQLANQYEAFIDRNVETQRIAVKVSFTSDSNTSTAFSVDKVHMLLNRRSRSQPTS